MSKTPFKDMHGNDVTVGDKIRIVSCYSFQYRNGQEAEVTWDAQHGMYNFEYDEIRRGTKFHQKDDFYGIHEFELIKK